jgi:hypothetical protein
MTDWNNSAEVAQYAKRYEEAHKEERKAYHAKYYQDHKEEKTKYAAKYARSHKREITGYTMKYRQAHKEEIAKYHAEYRQDIKRQTMIKVSGKVECVAQGCGCDDLRFLELDYKDGGHNALVRAGKLNAGRQLYRDIISGRVDPNLFEVLCRAHNAVYHLEKKLGVKWEIRYQPSFTKTLQGHKKPASSNGKTPTS